MTIGGGDGDSDDDDINRRDGIGIGIHSCLDGDHCDNPNHGDVLCAGSFVWLYVKQHCGCVCLNAANLNVRLHSGDDARLQTVSDFSMTSNVPVCVAKRVSQ